MKKYYLIIFSVAVVFAIRFLFSFLPSFQVDMGTWLAWAGRLKELGPSGFYSDTVWTQYTPGFLYYLLALGKLGWVSALAVKIPVIIADIVAGGILWKIVKKYDYKIAKICFFLYTVNPAVVFNGSVWGQIDGILTLFLLLSIYFLIEKKNLLVSYIFWGIAFIIKPQAIALLPLLLAISYTNFGFKRVILGALTSFLTIIILALPFFPSNPIFGIFDLVKKMGAYYPYTSLFAFNFWTLSGMWKADNQLFLGLSQFSWGAVLVSISLLGIFLKFKNKLNDLGVVYLLSGLSSFVFFLFPTRVHERYLFPALIFLLIYAGIKKSKGLLTLFGVVSILHLINLYHPYSYYENAGNFLKIQSLQDLSGNIAPLISLGLIAIFFLIIFWEELKIERFFDSLYKKILLLKREKMEVADSFPRVVLSHKRTNLILIGIIAFAFCTRVYSLGSPKKEYFDEVYHAFTAKVMMHTDANKAWEWWNTSPEGFAYEWTHPPLAKLGMALGMKLFGENSFGYRFPGAVLGTLSIYLIYLIARHLFKDELVGLLSAAVFSLDGLPLVMSRIGMNDTYFLFFALLSIYMFMRSKNLLSALAFGLSLASKWSAIWAVPILGIIWLRRSFKGQAFKVSVFRPLIWFLLLPFTVYLFTYLPMFLTGHDLSTWWGMQKQMWWYHTGLKATHPYTSMWWSWPFLIRPVYLYTSDEVGGFVARIYAMGNPLVFWFGLSSIITGFIYAFFEKNKRIGFIVFSYLIFFVPWALSPRIMFFYHYLPSVPFLAIASGYVLRRNPKLILGYLFIGLLVFIYFYPHWAALQIPLWLDKSYYWISSWR